MIVSWPVITAVRIGATAAVPANVISLGMVAKTNSGWGTEVRNGFKQHYPENRLVFWLDSWFVMVGPGFRPTG